MSLVAFSLQELRPGFLPLLGKLLFKPVSNHEFLNVRTYVRAGDESGIYFLAEWLNNRLATPLGRPIFGLPYCFGRIDYRHDAKGGEISGEVVDKRGRLEYRGMVDSARMPAPCRQGSLDEFLLERYTAFTYWRGLRRYFRVWHPPWPVVPLDARIENASLLELTGPWVQHAQPVAAHYSPGVTDVRMGPPQFPKRRKFS